MPPRRQTPGEAVAADERGMMLTALRTLIEGQVSFRELIGEWIRNASEERKEVARRTAEQVERASKTREDLGRHIDRCDERASNNSEKITKIEAMLAEMRSESSGSRAALHDKIERVDGKFLRAAIGIISAQTLIMVTLFGAYLALFKH